MNKKSIVTICKGGRSGILSRMLLVLLLFGLFGCGRQDSFQVAIEQESQALYSDQDQTGNLEEADSSQEEEQILYVHVCGAVNQSGVYPCKKGDRVFQLIEAAGGFAQDACPEALNQAQEVEDGAKIYVPTLEEWEQMGEQNLLQSMDHIGDDRININTADETMLCTLPGIGASKAQAILSYRREHGAFQRAEDIQAVSGTGSGVYSKIQDMIKVD